MPKRTDIKKILIIGSGPIIIMRAWWALSATEFGRAGLQPRRKECREKGL
jgi:hypothetical protein